MSMKDVIGALTKHRSPLAKKVHDLYARGSLVELQELKVDPLSYRDSESLWRDNLCVELLRKAELPGSAESKRQVAVDEFWTCEAQNYETNQRLRILQQGGQTPEETSAPFSAIVHEWQAEVARILGPLPRDLVPTFSGGATVVDCSNKTTVLDKLESVPCMYHGTKLLEPLFERTTWSQLHRGARNYVWHNVFFTVPKDGLKDRGCCKEAPVSLGYQLAVGSILMDRLLEATGCCLRTGQDRHRVLARESSVHGLLATEDMSNASDLISREFVRIGLKKASGWFSLLDSLRAPYTEIDGVKWRLEKFSSMGNGFTFPLESILFCSLARVLTRALGGNPEWVSVYGDDIILPSFVSRTYRSAASYFGLKPNLRKSFAEGPFRESCGGDFFLGCSVRGVNLEELPEQPHQWISLANNLRRSAMLAPKGAHRASRLKWVQEAWLVCLNNIPSSIRRLRGPQALGDVVIHDAPDKWCIGRPKGCEASWDQVWVRAWCPLLKPLKLHHWKDKYVLAGITLGLSSMGISPRASRGMPISYQERWVPLRGTQFLPSGRNPRYNRGPSPVAPGSPPRGWSRRAEDHK